MTATSRASNADDVVSVRPEFALIADVGDVRRFRLGPTRLPADVAYQTVHDELLLDGTARLNLATS